MKMIKQLSVFIENKFGRLSAVTEVLKNINVDINALSLADTSDFGILRLVVDKPEEAAKELTQHGITVKCTNVIAAAMDDRPGGLAAILDILTKEKVNIEYMYAFMGKTDEKAWTVMRVDDSEKAERVLKENGVMTLDDTHRFEG